MNDAATSGICSGNQRNALRNASPASSPGIARGTIYNNVTEPRNLLGEIATALSREMLLRTEATSYNTPDLGVGKSIRNLPQLRRVMNGINDRYLAIQQDVLETYVDRGQLARLREPTITPSGRRTPGLKLDDPSSAAPIYANLFDDDNCEGSSLIWSRPNTRRGD